MNCKIYISGVIEGKSRDEIISQFSSAEEIWCAIGGVEIVNPISDRLDKSAQWRESMKEDTALLWQCDAVCLLPGWETSRGCRIEYQIAKECGMAIFLVDSDMVTIETYNAMSAVTTKGNIRALLKIAQAVRLVTGIPFGKIQEHQRTHVNFMARLLFANECRRLMSVNQMAKVMKINVPTAHRYIRKFNEEYRWNAQFARMANEVREMINNQNDSQQ